MFANNDTLHANHILHETMHTNLWSYWYCYLHERPLYTNRSFPSNSISFMKLMHHWIWSISKLYKIPRISLSCTCLSFEVSKVSCSMVISRFCRLYSCTHVSKHHNQQKIRYQLHTCQNTTINRKSTGISCTDVSDHHNQQKINRYQLLTQDIAATAAMVIKDFLCLFLVWVLTKSLERKITPCEMRCLKRAVNKTRHDKIKNTKIREMVGTTPILHHIQQQRIRWFGHLTRMAPHQLASETYNTKMSGFKARGRPRKTWTEGVKETLKTHAHNIPPTQAFKLAADRKLFLPSTPRMTQEDG